MGKPLSEIKITPYRLQILQYVADGKRNHEIAEVMNVRATAVQQQIYIAMTEFGKSSRSGLVAHLIRKNILK